jgi:hypothetical protein
MWCITAWCQGVAKEALLVFAPLDIKELYAIAVPMATIAMHIGNAETVKTNYLLLREGCL